MKTYSIRYLIDCKTLKVEARGFDQAQKQVAMIQDAGGEILSIQIPVKILENIDYTLSRKGHRLYWIIDDDGCIVDGSGCWRSKAACRRRIGELGLTEIGLVTENRNYRHWADFVPVKEGRMMDDEQ